MTASVTTSKRIDLNQLCGEIGGAELRAVTRDADTTIGGEVGQATLEAAVAAHVAVDRTGNESTLRSQAVGALKANRDFLGITAPADTRIAAQVKALTKQNNGIIRILLQQFDGTD